MQNVIKVKGVVGDFNVVRNGDTVEFYDARYPNFGEHGQFVSDYYISTILEDSDGNGLDLDGGIDEWTIPADSMAQVIDFLKR